MTHIYIFISKSACFSSAHCFRIEPVLRLYMIRIDVSYSTLVLNSY